MEEKFLFSKKKEIMASTEELYISVSLEDYRRDKSNILTSQADLLITLKRLHKLKVLARQKNDFKKRLYKLLSLVLVNIDSIQEEVPTPKIPKLLQKEEPAKLKESSSRRDAIEDELRLIQRKLQELNS